MSSSATVRSKSGKVTSVSSESVAAKTPDGTLTIPLRELSDVESLACGLRQEMLSIGDKEAKGTLCTGTGLGSDFILLEWRGRKAVVLGRDLFRLWVATFAPDDAKRMESL